MKHKISIKAFFFDAKKDYLPYYKNFSFTLEGTTVLHDVLGMIAHANREFAYPESRCWLRLNDRVISGAVTVEQIVERLGSEWTLEPLMERRARHALVIDDSDFEQAFELIAPWAEAGDRAYYESLYPLYYASESFRFAPDYIGDAVLLTAHRIIQRTPESADEILHTLSEAPCGLYCAEYENNLFEPRDESAVIEALKHKIFRPRKAPLSRKIVQKLCKKSPLPFQGYGVEGGSYALYTGPESGDLPRILEEKLSAKGGSLVPFERSDRLIGRTLIECNPDLACLKAGTMIASAYDSGALALIFAKDVDLKYVRDNFAAIERVMNRELPLPMIAYSEFVSRFLGEEAQSIPAAS